MASGSIGKKELFKAIKTAVPKGSHFRQAMKTAATFGIKKGAGGKIVQSQAVKLIKELKSEHVLKSRVGEVATAGATAKHILQAAVVKKPEPVAEKNPPVPYKEQQAARLAEKEKILEEQHLRKASDVVHERTAHGYIVERQKEEEASGGGQASKPETGGRTEERGSANLSSAPLPAPPPAAPDKAVVLSAPPVSGKEKALAPEETLEGEMPEPAAPAATPPPPLRQGYAEPAAPGPAIDPFGE